MILRARTFKVDVVKKRIFNLVKQQDIPHKNYFEYKLTYHMPVLTRAARTYHVIKWAAYINFRSIT